MVSLIGLWNRPPMAADTLLLSKDA